MKLMSKKAPLKEQSYLTLKVVTLDINEYKVINDRNLWGTFQVRNFEWETRKKWNNFENQNQVPRNDYQQRAQRRIDIRQRILERNTLVNRRFGNQQFGNRQNGNRPFENHSIHDPIRNQNFFIETPKRRIILEKL